ncbi:MAG: GNAT family N-acetyltransferase [Ferruginibacter sp.]|nr:GNAT family N-acetyltransferase [Bacteroidota bacterium]MBX2919396.1 GNAT family N-acetyltransferase [Ferruginibacter sp.]MCB0708081.1 GNAT family N-acetyltransferase [Chitinophagaceae bacterium]
MHYREALINDIPQIQMVRNSVKENQLPHPSYVTDKDVEDYILNKGKGWVCEIKNRIAGFAIADLVDDNIWALFVHPQFEAMGIGKTLHRIMLDWYFENSKEKVWLSTDPYTRAYEFYKQQGWKEVGTYGNGEAKFEMYRETWLKNRNNKY